MNAKLRAYLALHFCIFLWGFTAILGKLLTLQALPLVWWRVLLCSLSILFILPGKKWTLIPRQLRIHLFGIGLLVGVHWLCFYGAIKLSNASIAVTTMATTSFFSAVAEPLIIRRKFKWYELALGILVLPGMLLVVGSLNWSMRLGFGVGVLGAFLAAVFSALNKRIVDSPEGPPPALLMSLLEMLGALAVTSVALPFVWMDTPDMLFWLRGWDWLWMMILVWACTLLPFYLSLLALRHISAFSSNLALNLEPVYGVLLAAVIFQEHKELNPGFYIGVLIILLAVFGHPFLKKLVEKK